MPSLRELDQFGAALRLSPVKPDARHSPDFVSVFWFGTEYTFTTNQAACVKVLWEAWTNRTPTLAQETILDAAGISQDRLDMVFRGHAAWGAMIVTPLKGKYRLKEPDGSAT